MGDFSGVSGKYDRIVHRILIGVFIIGALLAFIGNIVMIWIFERLNSRRRTENELQQLNHQYSLEKERYENLKSQQDEMAKMRHDFQNYILTLKNME